MACLIIGSSSLRISGRQATPSEQVRYEFLNKINSQRLAERNGLGRLVNDQILNQIDEFLSDSYFLKIDQTQFELNSRQSTNGVLEFDSEIGLPDTFVVQASDLQSAWQLLNQNQQWRKILLDKDTKLFGAAVLKEYYVVSLKKGSRDSTISQDQRKALLQAFKKSISAQNPTVQGEDVDLSNRIAEWITNGKPEESVLAYFNSISYKPGEQVGFKAYEGSQKTAYDQIVNNNYFKLDNSAIFTQFGIATEVNAEGEIIINVVFAG